MLNILLGVTASYLIGSIPTSFLIAKTRGVDVRKEGSGNVGATNVLRAVGKLPAAIALIIDVAKGVIAVTLLVSFFFVPEGPISFNAFRALLGLSAVIGHNWSIFLKFKGGKGVATTCGVLMILLPKAMAIAALVFLITIFLTKYVSLGSILLSLAVPIAAALFSRDIELVLLAITLCILISYKHKSNIKRLLAGTENKLGHK